MKEKTLILIKSVLKKLRVEERIAITVAVGIEIIILIVAATNYIPPESARSLSPLGILELIVRYFTFGDRFFRLFFLFVWLTVIWNLYLLLGRTVTKYADGKKIEEKEVFDQLKDLFRTLRPLFPIVILLIPCYGLLQLVSYLLRFTTNDITLFQWDYSLFGGTGFLLLSSFQLSPFLERIIFYSYIMLSILTSVTIIFFTLTKNYLLVRKCIFALLISFVIALTSFVSFPCQDFNHFFLRNERGNQIPPTIENSLSEHTISLWRQNKIEKIGKAETNFMLDNTVPITCFPSAHAMWTIFIVYFFATWSAWTLVVSVPWLIFLLIGGVYFAQHYIVDYLIALPIAILCIVIANKLIKEEGK